VTVSGSLPHRTLLRLHGARTSHPDCRCPKKTPRRAFFQGLIKKESPTSGISWAGKLLGKGREGRGGARPRTEARDGFGGKENAINLTIIPGRERGGSRGNEVGKNNRCCKRRSKFEATN